MSTNPFARLVRLLPSTPLRVGTVTAVNGTAVSVQEPGGTIVVVRGEATVGARVYFQGGVIDSPAPVLPGETVAE
jgi:hypothetical protein